MSCVPGETWAAVPCRLSHGWRWFLPPSSGLLLWEWFPSALLLQDLCSDVQPWLEKIFFVPNGGYFRFKSSFNSTSMPGKRNLPPESYLVQTDHEGQRENLTPSPLGPVPRVDLSNARAEKNLISVNDVFPLCFNTYLEWSVCLLRKAKLASENRVKPTCLTQTLRCLLFFVSPFQERKPSPAPADKPSVSLLLLPSVTSSFTSPAVLPAAPAPGLHDPLLWGRLQLHPGQQLRPLLLPNAALHQRAPPDLGHPAVTPKTLLGGAFFFFFPLMLL